MFFPAFLDGKIFAYIREIECCMTDRGRSNIHNDRQDHRLALGLGINKFGEIILDLVFELRPVDDAFVQTSI